MPTDSRAAQALKTIELICDGTRDVLASMANRVEQYKVAGRDDVAAELAAEAMRYAVNRRRDYYVAVNDFFDAEMLDAGIPMDLIVKSEVIYERR